MSANGFSAMIRFRSAKQLLGSATMSVDLQEIDPGSQRHVRSTVEVGVDELAEHRGIFLLLRSQSNQPHTTNFSASTSGTLPTHSATSGASERRDNAVAKIASILLQTSLASVLRIFPR